MMGGAPMSLTAGQKIKWINATYFTIAGIPNHDPSGVTIKHFSEMPLLTIPRPLAEGMRLAYLDSIMENK